MSKRHKYCPDRDGCIAPARGKCTCQSVPSDRVLHPKEYYAWTNMKTRCVNHNYYLYANYGGRGISVCQEWAGSFKSFLSDVGASPFPEAILDRTDNNKGYDPGNVMWVNAKESSINRRSVKKLDVHGVSKTLPEWECESGISRKIIWRRIKDGWPSEMAVFAPPMPRVFCAKPDPIKAYFESWSESHTVNSCGGHDVQRKRGEGREFLYRLVINDGVRK